MPSSALWTASGPAASAHYVGRTQMHRLRRFTGGATLGLAAALLVVPLGGQAIGQAMPGASTAAGAVSPDPRTPAPISRPGRGTSTPA